jgi:hypothetical protein
MGLIGVLVFSMFGLALLENMVHGEIFIKESSHRPQSSTTWNG